MLKISVVQRGLHTSTRLLDKPSSLMDSIIRVDHAGELGADRIYAGQMAVLGKTKVGPVIQEMWEQEKHHKAKFEELIVKHRVRPTVLTPFWNIAGFALGAGTALLGEKAAMACTVAVESVIVDHYNDQLRSLMVDKNPDKELLDTIKKFRDDEQEHHDCGLDHGAEQAPFYQALTEVIKFGCRAAISASKSLLQPPLSINIIHSRHYSTGQRWDLVSAVCLERKPAITKSLTPFEKLYKSTLEELELYGSKRSDHELRLEEDAKRAELLKHSENFDADIETALKQSGQDFEDAGSEELAKFKFAPKTGSSDVKSIGRKLDMHLVLMTKMRLGDKDVWCLPQCVREEGETMRDTADRILTLLGPSVQADIFGNAPVGFYKYKYPSSGRLHSVGAKIFFFKGLFISGGITINKDLFSDYQWATRGEMDKLIVKTEYLRSIQAFLIDEEDEIMEQMVETEKEQTIRSKRITTAS